MSCVQIENLKLAREEAEHLRTDNTRLRGDYDAVMHELEDVRRHHKDALDRLAQQSEALLYALNHFKTKGADGTVFDQVRGDAGPLAPWDPQRPVPNPSQRSSESAMLLLCLCVLNIYATKYSFTDAVVLQMKAVAEATINELKQRLKDRDRAIAALRAQLDDEAAKALERHNQDRAEIERLNQKLFELNDQTIQDLKVRHLSPPWQLHAVP